jgi:hypothetical protein
MLSTYLRNRHLVLVRSIEVDVAFGVSRSADQIVTARRGGK